VNQIILQTRFFGRKDSPFLCAKNLRFFAHKKGDFLIEKTQFIDYDAIK